MCNGGSGASAGPGETVGGWELTDKSSAQWEYNSLYSGPDGPTAHMDHYEFVNHETGLRLGINIEKGSYPGKPSPEELVQYYEDYVPMELKENISFLNVIDEANDQVGVYGWFNHDQISTINLTSEAFTRDHVAETLPHEAYHLVDWRLSGLKLDFDNSSDWIESHNPMHAEWDKAMKRDGVTDYPISDHSSLEGLLGLLGMDTGTEDTGEAPEIYSISQGGQYGGKGAQNYCEDRADSVALYVMDPEKFKSEAPNRAELIEKYLFKDGWTPPEDASTHNMAD